MISRHSSVSEGRGGRFDSADYEQPEPSEHSYGRLEESPAPHDGSPEVPSIEQLRARGKGVYTCPHKERCKKGGVYPDGRIKIFSRNSEFRYVPFPPACPLRTEC